MEISPLHNPDGGNAASALENLAHRLVAVHQAKSSEPRAGRRVEDIVDIPLFSADEFGLDDPAEQAVAVAASSFIDRIRHFFS